MYGFKTNLIIGAVGRYKIIDYFKVYTPNTDYLFLQPDVLAILLKY